MSLPLAPGVLERLFAAACLAELQALKPGNVHRFAPGHGMEVAHFERAAAAAAPYIANPHLSVGARIEGAVDASFRVAGCNTNLGIVLLAAPLAVAAGAAGGPQDLRARLNAVLARLDTADAAHAFRAITRANPAGLGRAEAGDVAGPAEMTLREAMALAADRDRIGLAYTTDYADIFDLGLPTLWAARQYAPDEITRDVAAITALHMAYLALIPDSHIARKHGLAAALAVQQEAKIVEANLSAKGYAAAFSELLAFDRSLKARGLNPGTTADFVVATLFAASILAASDGALRG